LFISDRIRKPLLAGQQFERVGLLRCVGGELFQCSGIHLLTLGARGEHEKGIFM
jgi:hypothetical protein